MFNQRHPVDMNVDSDSSFLRNDLVFSDNHRRDHVAGMRLIGSFSHN